MTGRDEVIEQLVRDALAEDVGDGDRTTEWTVPESTAEAVIVAKQRLTVAGMDPALRVFHSLASDMETQVVVPDGGVADVEEVVLRLTGPVRAILTGERTALNFLGRLSGIATLTRAFTEAIAGTGARVIDTRKTTPGWRLLEKEAVRSGGGANHRMGLYDMVLVKDNHIAAAGGISAAVAGVAAHNAQGLPVEVEVSTLAELDEVLELGVDRVLLDNMTPAQLARAVARARASAGPVPQLEASGNVSLASVRAVAETGVDLISVGALTHSAPSADLSLRVLRR